MSATNLGQSSKTKTPAMEGAYGLPDVLTYGTNKVRDKLEASHPLQKNETNFAKRQERMELDMLRKTQGVHAPLRLVIERRAAERVRRLPFLPSSNLQLQVLRGELEFLDVTETLHTPEHYESMGQPHAVVEHSMGLL